MKPRIYVDTSVVGGCEDDEFREYSRRLMRAFVRGEFLLVLSNLSIQELTAAPDAVLRHLRDVPEWNVVVRELDAEATSVAEDYISMGVITPSMRVDGLHVAIATVARLDVLVSWDFKHIVNLQRIRGYNSVNLRLGYPALEIRSPAEVFSDE